MSLNNSDVRYGIYVSITTLKQFEENRSRLGLSAETYLLNLMAMDYTGKAVLSKRKYVDLKQTRLYRSDDIKRECDT